VAELSKKFAPRQKRERAKAAMNHFNENMLIPASKYSQDI